MQKAKVVSAVSIGVHETIDLEVDHPDHQFLVNGILTSNSHANAYGYLGYVCQYLKSNYTLEWWTSVLRNSSILDLKKNAEHCHDMVSPPHINGSDTDFFITNTQDNKIIYPLRMVKGVASAADDIVRARGQTPFTSLTDFYNRVPRKAVNKRVVHALVWVGAMDSLSPMAEGDVVTIRNSLWSTYLNLRGESAAFIPRGNYDVLALQGDLMPFGSPDISSYISEVQGCKMPAEAKALWDEIPERHKKGFTAPVFDFAGIVTTAKRHVTKNGKPMMFIDISGSDAILSVLVFEEAIHAIPAPQMEALLRGGSVIRARGKLSERDSRLSLLANSITLLNQTQTESHTDET